jgi:alkylation response protein AidB-like acyl-CoA dehydrogenase
VTVDLGLTDDQQLFRETTRKFLEDSCPLATVRRIATEEPRGFDREWWRRGADLGWVSMLVPEDLGGGSVSGQGLCDLALVAEEMGRLVSPGPLAPTNVVAAALARAGTPTQRKQLLGDLVSGDTVAAWCPGGTLPGIGPLTGGAGGEVTARSTRDGFVLEGTSRPVEAGGEADLVLVTAPSDRGMAQFVVAPDAAGLTAVPVRSVDLVRRFARLRFDQVEVGGDAVLGEPGSVEGDVERQLQDAVVIQCAEMVGAIDRVFEFTVEYASDRYSFGRPLSSYQALKHRFADMKMWLEACHATAVAAGRAVDCGSPEAAELVSVAKSYIGDHAPIILQDCVQLHGGIGVTWDHDLHLYLRRVMADRAQFGTPRDHRHRVAAVIGL